MEETTKEAIANLVMGLISLGVGIGWLLVFFQGKRDKGAFASPLEVCAYSMSTLWLAAFSISSVLLVPTLLSIAALTVAFINVVFWAIVGAEVGNKLFNMQYT